MKKILLFLGLISSCGTIELTAAAALRNLAAGTQRTSQILIPQVGKRFISATTKEKIKEILENTLFSGLVINHARKNPKFRYAVLTNRDFIKKLQQNVDTSLKIFMDPIAAQQLETWLGKQIDPQDVIKLENKIRMLFYALGATTAVGIGIKVDSKVNDLLIRKEFFKAIRILIKSDPLSKEYEDAINTLISAPLEERMKLLNQGYKSNQNFFLQLSIDLTANISKLDPSSSQSKKYQEAINFLKPLLSLDTTKELIMHQESILYSLFRDLNTYKTDVDRCKKIFEKIHTVLLIIPFKDRTELELIWKHWGVFFDEQLIKNIDSLLVNLSQTTTTPQQNEEKFQQAHQLIKTLFLPGNREMYDIRLQELKDSLTKKAEVEESPTIYSELLPYGAAGAAAGVVIATLFNYFTNY